MKIKATAPPRLPLGSQLVKIVAVDQVEASEYQGVPYLNVQLENGKGSLEQRFYLSEAGQPILASFIQALGLDPALEHQSESLVGRSLQVDIEEHTYRAPDDNNERTIKQATHFQSVDQSVGSPATK